MRHSPGEVPIPIDTAGTSRGGPRRRFAAKAGTVLGPDTPFASVVDASVRPRSPGTSGWAGEPAQALARQAIRETLHRLGSHPTTMAGACRLADRGRARDIVDKAMPSVSHHLQACRPAGRADTTRGRR
jgi:hypothetical protein